MRIGSVRRASYNLLLSQDDVYMAGSGIVSANMLFAYSAYFIGIASPGPSNLAIMSIATTDGRRPAFMFALGVMTGSLFWALLATLGVSAAMMAWSHFVVAVKIFGGVYLLWLAFKSGRSALTVTDKVSQEAGRSPPLAHLYARGALLHLTNPKAILVWISIAALASSTTGNAHPVAMVPGCLVIGITVFGGYALVFSTATARRLYTRIRRVLEACLAIVFALAGVRLLASRV